MHKDGQIVWGEVASSIIRDHQGNSLYFISYVRDITEQRQYEENIIKSEEKYRGLVDNSIVGVFTSNLKGEFVFVNDAIVQMYDFDSPEQMLASKSLARWTDLEDRERMLALLKKHGRVTNFEAETLTHRDRSIHVLFSAKLFGENIFGMVMDITERKHAEKKILEHQERLSALSSQLILAEELERRRIATDLHDQVSQNLALSCLQLSAAIQSVDDIALKKQFDELNQTLISASKDTRNLIFDLSSPTMHELGLGPAISEWIDDKLIQRHGLDVQLVDKLKRDSLDLNQSAILFRSVRELLTNIVKYARADKVNVLLEHEGNDIRITVKDNGIGFSPEQARQSISAEGGLGLFSIEERMTGLGGSMVIDSKAHHGTTIVLMIPLNEMKKVTT
jgi:PAS domain S-box-containing protein